MADFKLRKNPDSGSVVFWEPGMDDWAEVQAKRNPESGEVIILSEGAAEWRNLGVYNGTGDNATEQANPAPIAPEAKPQGFTDQANSLEFPTPQRQPAEVASPAPNEAPMQPPAPAMPDAMPSFPIPGPNPLAEILNPQGQFGGDVLAKSMLRAGENPAAQLAELMQPPAPAPQPPEIDPFAGEGFGPLAKRRGQQFARGATEVFASVPEGAALAGVRHNPNASALMASETVQRAQEQLTLADKRLADFPDMNPEDRARVDAVRADALKTIEANQPLVDLAAEQGKPLKSPVSESAVFKAGDKIRGASKGVFGEPDPRDHSFWAQLFEGGGNMTALAISSIATGPAGMATGGALGSSMNASQLYKEALAAGADEQTALQAAGWGASIGVSEIIPINRALKLLPQRFRGKIANGMMRKFVNIAQSSGEEAAQEYLATVANNIVADKLYEPGRGWTEGATEAALVGAVLGGGMGVVGTTFGGKNEGAAVSPTRQDEEDEGPSLAPIADQVEAAAAKAGKAPDQTPNTVAPVQPVAPNAPSSPAEQLAAAMGAPVPQKQPTPAAPQAQPKPEPEAMPQGERFEIMDETETVNGESVPTGGKVIFDHQTQTLSPYEPGKLAPDSADAAVQSQPQDASVVGADAAPVADTAPEQTEPNREALEQAAIERLRAMGIEQPKKQPQKRPFTFRMKGIGINPQGRAAQDLKAMGVTPQSAPGLFKAGGHSDLDNLPLLEWRENYPEAQADQTGLYVEPQWFKDNLANEVAGFPVFDRDQQFVQDDQDAWVEALEAEIDHPLSEFDDTPKESPDLIIPSAEMDISTGGERFDLTQSLVRKLATELEASAWATDEQIAQVVADLDSNGGNATFALLDLMDAKLGDMPTSGVEAENDIPFTDEEFARYEQQTQEPDAGTRPQNVDAGAERDGGPTGDPGTEGGSPENSGNSNRDPQQARTEETDAGQQRLIPGVTPVNQRDKLEAEMNKPKVGGNAAPPAGRGDLFGDPSDRRDLFDQEQAAKPEPTKPTQTANDLRKVTLDKVKLFSRDGDFDDHEHWRDISTSPQGKKLYADIAAAKDLDARIEIANQFVVEVGKKSGKEILVSLDQDGVPMAIGRGGASNLAFPSYLHRMDLEGELSVLTHNHPQSNAFSRSDFLTAKNGGTPVFAMGHNGNQHQLKMVDETDSVTDQDFLEAYDAGNEALQEMAQSVFDQLPVQTQATLDAYNDAFHSILTLAFERMGLYEYQGDAQGDLDRAGVKLDDFYTQIKDAVAPILGRGGFDVSDERGSQGDSASQDTGSVGAVGTDANQVPGTDTPTDNGTGRADPEETGKLTNWPQPNEHGVFSRDDVTPENRVSFDIDRPKKWQGVERLSIHVLQVGEGKWISAMDYSLPESGGSSPLTTHATFKTRDAALADAITKGRMRVTSAMKGTASNSQSAIGRKILDYLDGIDPEPTAKDDFDGALDDMFGGVETKKTAKKAPKPKRSKAEIAKDMQSIIRGLKEDSAPQIEDSKYNQLTPLFIEALDGFDPGQSNRRQTFATMMKPLAQAGLTREDVTVLRPYFERFLDDVESGKISLEGETDAPSPSLDLERNSGDTDPSDQLGGTDVPASPRGDGQSSDDGGGATDQDSGQRKSGSGVSDSDASGLGKRGDSSVSDGKRKAGQSADDRDGTGRSDRGKQRLPDDTGRAEDTAQHARDAPELTDRKAAQDKADNVPVKLGDPDNIAKTLPLLLPEQHDDVAKTEARFAKKDKDGKAVGHGMLITNGTGTGKTYSGGGVIKRFVQSGKDNVLILAPSQGILDAWLDMGKDLGLDISKLDDTKTPGKGIVAATYANAAENESLADRDWDLVVSDEAHKLSQNAAGDATGALHTVRNVTNRPADLRGKARMQLRAEWAKYKLMPDGEEGFENASLEDVQAYKDAKRGKYYELHAKEDVIIEKLKKQPRSKVLFLSATPFAYDKNVDYAEGYLFDYGKEGVTESGSRQDGRSFFFVENFGYRIRYHKLTKPEAAVDNGVFEREFHERLRREGVLSGRQLDIDADYDRKFVQLADSKGEKIDAAMKLIWDNSSNTPEGRKWRELGEHVRRNFTYLRRLQLLEAIKARHSVPDIKAHLALGRKVVVFHDYNKGGGFNPFTGSEVVTPKAEAMEGYKLLLAQMPEVRDLNFAGYKPPVEALTGAFGDKARVYSGTVSQKDRKASKEAFNTDGSGVDVLIVQSAAGEAGISLHDVTGGHQRTLVNLGMPTRPTTTLQEEGRIRRVGSVSDAVFRYYTTGTTWEREAFAGKIAERSGTVENLALGNEARAIRESFIQAYMDADTITPSLEDGKGGRDADRSQAKTSPYDQAKTHYFARTKNTKSRNQRQGLDFYSTPEPLGFKMAEWAGVRTYEKALEPSAGDGAIARYIRADADRTIIEPSTDLITKAQLRAVGAKAINERFEDHHVINKYDAVLMNPPFGSGGKTAMDHVSKALKHLKPGGRLVALIPTGPAADKQLMKHMDEWDATQLQWTADVNLPSVTFEKAGTTVASRVLIIDKVAPTRQTQRINMTGSDTIANFFERLEDIAVPERPEQQADPVEDTTPEAAHISAPLDVDTGPLDSFEFENTKTGAEMFGVQIKEKLGDQYKAVATLAKSHGGYYSRYQNKTAGAKRGFLFNNDADRQAFIDDLAKPVQGLKEQRGEPNPTEAAAEALTFAMPRLRAELDRLNLKRVKLSIDRSGSKRLGAFRIDDAGVLEILVAPSLDPDATLHHEAIHALRALNVFTPQEWKALEMKAARTWVEQFDVAKRYPDLLPSEQIEEAVAEAFAAAAKTKTAPKGSILVQAFNKIARVFKAMGNALRGAGFQTTQDVFGRVRSGEVGARPGQSPTIAALKEARGPTASRQTANQRAHAGTAANHTGGGIHIPDRRIWEELNNRNAGIWERLKGGSDAAYDWVDKGRVNFQDRFLPVLRAQEAIMRQTGAKLDEQYNAYVAEETYSGKVGDHLSEIDEDYTKRIIAIMVGEKKDAKMKIEDVDQWLYARHAVERNAKIASINANMQDGGSGMENADAAAILSNAAASPHSARLNEIGQIIDDLRERSLALRESSGLITPQEATLWRSMYSHYVPLKGWEETDHSEAFLDLTGLGRRYNVQGAESKRALGRGSLAFGPLQGALTQAQEVAIRAEKNQIGQALYKLAKDHPAAKLWSVKKPAQKRYYNRTTGLVETRTEDPVSLFKEPNEIAVKVGGKERRILFHDSRVAKAVTGLGGDQLNWFMKMMMHGARWFSSVNTMMDPEFVIRNAIRDMTAAQINIRNFGKDDRNAIAKAMVRDWPKAFAGAYRGQLNKADTEWTKYYKEFSQSGAKVSFWKLDDATDARSDLQKRLKLEGGNVAQRASKYFRISTRDNPVLGFVERTNLAVDNAIRLAAFVAARRAGWSKAEAASLSKNLTVNFNRKGEWGASINALYPFANAGLQGTQILFRAMTTKRMAKYALGMVGLGVILDMTNAWLSEEDEDGELAYDKIPAWKTQMNLVVMLGMSEGSADNAATLWMPYGYSLFPYLGQQASKVMRGVKEPEDALADFAGAMFGAFSPMTGGDLLSTITPTMIDPVSEMYRNQDWLGRPIRPESPYADYGPDAYKYYSGVSMASRGVSDALNRGTGGTIAESGTIDISPEYLDHIFGFATGGMGRTTGRTADALGKLLTGQHEEIDSRNIPFYRSLKYDTSEWLDRDRYYRFRNDVREANDAAKTYKENRQAVPKHIVEKASLYKLQLDVGKELRNNRKQRRAVQARDDLVLSEKSDRISRIDEQAANYYIRFNKAYVKKLGPQGE